MSEHIGIFDLDTQGEVEGSSISIQQPADACIGVRCECGWAGPDGITTLIQAKAALARHQHDVLGS